MAYIKSGHLLPLTADGAEADFSHSSRTGWIASLLALEIPALGRRPKITAEFAN
jgi:hypothetical protein